MLGETGINGEAQGRPAGVTFLALGFAAGIAIGAAAPVAAARPIWPWLVAALAMVVVAGVSRRRPRLAVAALGLLAMLLGAWWVRLRTDQVAADDLAAGAGQTPTPLHVRGVALATASVQDADGSALARFDFRTPTTWFPLRVEALVGPDGGEMPANGRLWVRVRETVAPFQAGDRVRVRGMLHAPSSPWNPGVIDSSRALRARGFAGTLVVETRELLQVTPGAGDDARSAVLAVRSAVRRRAEAWLFAGLPGGARAAEREALLAALLLGRRKSGGDGIDDAFRRVGLAHLLAISGLHLGVLVGAVGIVARGVGVARARHGGVVIVVVLLYLFLVEVRLPVLRASIMTIAAALGMASGRRWQVGSLIAVGGVLLLAWRPDELFRPGFQLSFGVVLALVHLVPAVRRRWFGPPNRLAGSSAEMIGQWLAGAASVAAVAWAVAIPITAFHFGTISPWAVPLSVVTLPAVAALLALGFTKMLLMPVLPSAGLLIGAALSVVADLVVSLVTAVDTLPGSVLRVPRPRAAWTLITLACIVVWGRGIGRRRRRRRRLAGAGVGAVLVIWLYAPLYPWRDAPRIRLDMIAVGNGSCYVLRSAGRTLVFDAGSSTYTEAGRRIIVPALRAIGVRSVDLIAVSHANLDHYSAVLDLVDAFGTTRVLVTPQLERQVASEPGGPTAFLLSELSRAGVAITTVADGDERRLGEATLRWLHPRPDASYANVNDASMVVLVETPPQRLLLTGDIQRAGIDDLLARHPGLRADVLELPHHGGFGEAAVRLVRHVTPSIVLQSTGRRRWRRDPWSPHLGGIRRLVTARDGACRVEIREAGADPVPIRSFTFRRANAMPSAHAEP